MHYVNVYFPSVKQLWNSCSWYKSTQSWVQPIFLLHITVYHFRVSFAWYSFQHTEIPSASQQYKYIYKCFMYFFPMWDKLDDFGLFPPTSFYSISMSSTARKRSQNNLFPKLQVGHFTSYGFLL